MSSSLPTCPKCDGTLRAADFDGFRCRCGFEINHEALEASRSTSPYVERSLMLAAGRTPPDAKPGIHIAESFAELHALCWNRRLEKPRDPNVAQQMREAAIASGARRGLAFQHDHARGACLVVKVPGGWRELKREMLYGLAPFGREVEAARQMVDRIADLRGPGSWWSLLDPVHVIQNDGSIQVADVGGLPHVYLRAIYCHLPTCPLCGKACDRVDVGGMKLSGCACVGTKDAAITMLNDDLRAGRLKLPSKPVWNREHLGQWVSPAPAQPVRDPYPALPAAPPYRVKYEPITIDKAALDAAMKAARERMDRAIRALGNQTPAAGRCGSDHMVAVGDRVRWENAVLELAQRGEITSERARQLIDAPAIAPPAPPAPDPLDVKHGGVTLRDLLKIDEERRREGHPNYRTAWSRLSDAQRAAVSAHWSAELRARVQASNERERQAVVVDQGVE